MTVRSLMICCWILVVTIRKSAGEGSDLVEIQVGDGVYEYSMTVTPPADSPVVEKEKENLRGVLDLKSFVNDLGRIGKCIRVAYNGIGAAGPKFQGLQIQVQRLGFGISKLCDRSAVTIASFKTTTTTVLFRLKGAYQFLTDNRERMALDMFKTLAELAGKMAKAAENLQEEFESQEVKVNDALEEIQRRGSYEEIEIMELRAQQELAKVNVKEQEKLAREYAKLEADFRAERLRAERKEDKAMSSRSGFLGRLGNAVTSMFGLGNLFDDSSDAAAKANRWRQRSIEKLENEKEHRKLKQEALQVMAELVHDIKSMEGKEKLADVAVKALHKASWSMKQLIRLLRQAATFWNQLKVHCQGLADEKIEQFVANYTEEERRYYWNSLVFKQNMFIYMSKWVALNNVSGMYLDQIRETQKDLYNYIMENPTHEDSKRDLQKLASDFEEDLKAEEERIREQNFKAQQEILQLEAAEKAEEGKPKKTEL